MHEDNSNPSSNLVNMLSQAPSIVSQPSSRRENEDIPAYLENMSLTPLPESSPSSTATDDDSPRRDLNSYSVLPRGIPKFNEKGIPLLISIVRWVGEHVARVRWTNGEIVKYMGRRSAQEILESGHTFYMNPCLDLTLVTSAVLKEQGVYHKLVMDEVASVPDFPFNRLHFALEIIKGRGVCFIDYPKLNLADIGSGRYVRKQSPPKIGTLSVGSSLLDPAKPLYQNLGQPSIDRLDIIFKGYKLAPQIERLQRDNTDETYRRVMALEDKSRGALDIRLV